MSPLFAEFEAHHPWFPETAEIIWGTVAFVIVVGVIVWKAGPGIKKAMADRSARIGRELEQAAKAKSDAEAESSRIVANLQDIDSERSRMMAEAQETGERVRTEGIARNDADVADMEARAMAEVEGIGNRITAEVQTEVAALAAEAAERVVVEQLDANRQAELVERFIATVGSGAR